MPVTFDSTDLDNSASETGVVHESVANTDHNNDNVLKQGYQIANPDLSANLVGYWPLQEDSGSTAFDFSGNNNDGTVIGASQDVTGPLGTSAYNFDGVDDYVDVPVTSGSSLDVAAPFSVSFWMNLNTASDEMVMQRYAWDGSNDLQTYVSSSSLRFGIAGEQEQFANSSVSTGTWLHMVGTYDGSQFEIFKNGTSQQTESASFTHQNNGEPWLIGTDSDASSAGSLGNWTNGSIVDVRVYSTALTSSEVQDIYDVVNTSGEIITSSKVA